MAKKRTTSTSTRTKTSKKKKKKTTRAKTTHASTPKKAVRKKTTRRRSSGTSSRAGMVYSFGKTRTDGDGSMRDLLGGKGANLAEMTSMGLPVPPGMTITTEACRAYEDAGGRFPHGLMNAVQERMAILEKEMGKRFGDRTSPLLVSVRSGAAVSMPGMMDTILNLGLTDESVEALAEATGNRRFAYDAYRRLINMFGDVVMDLDHDRFEDAFDEIKQGYGVEQDTDVPEDGLVELVDAYKSVYRRYVGSEFPQNPFKQLELAIEAVFKSWNSKRAIVYRKIHAITGLHGTAVNVQAMVFGNMGDDSATGVAFTRNPSTGENKFYAEFLVNAQGEDVVAGIRTPQPAEAMRRWNKKVYDQLLSIRTKLERHYKDMQDIEFTVQEGILYMLQTRTGKRTGRAAVKIACDMVKERLITEKQAILRVPADDLTQLLVPQFDHDAKDKPEPIATGLPASPGAAVGKPAFSAEEAAKRTADGEQVILVRSETSPEDIEGMHSAVGILTSTGGMTSHASVVARGWGKCCVVGAGALHIDASRGHFSAGGHTITRDDTISLDGATGEVFVGELGTVEPSLSGDFARLMRFADKHRSVGVRTNADTPGDAQRAREFGAKGIGLCRTEHMFFESDRITPMRAMILADTREHREAALAELLPFQRDDFVGIFTAMKGLPVTVRLLDPPLHEFLPHDDQSQAELARKLNMTPDEVRGRVAALHEANPMMGHRGCRLAITYPEILQMQVRAIAEAAIECLRRRVKVMPEIMIPLVGVPAELETLRAQALDTIAQVRKDQGWSRKLDIPIGTMIEIPRATLVADQIAQVADFFSFGTNDLTQFTFGYSRDDVNTFLADYLAKGILKVDPFQTLDQEGVGQLVQMGLERGRQTKKNLKVGICGEHGGNPASIQFCARIGMDYVSCSPFRVPVARLAAAQAALA